MTIKVRITQGHGYSFDPQVVGKEFDAEQRAGHVAIVFNGQEWNFLDSHVEVLDAETEVEQPLQSAEPVEIGLGSVVYIRDSSEFYRPTTGFEPHNSNPIGVRGTINRKTHNDRLIWGVIWDNGTNNSYATHDLISAAEYFGEEEEATEQEPKQPRVRRVRKPRKAPPKRTSQLITFYYKDGSSYTTRNFVDVLVRGDAVVVNSIKDKGRFLTIRENAYIPYELLTGFVVIKPEATFTYTIKHGSITSIESSAAPSVPFGTRSH